MQVKLNLIAGAAALLIGGAVYAQDLVVKIGHVGPTSGTAAHLGKDNEMGARMAIDELNAKGVTIGGKKAKFELLAEDGRSTETGRQPGQRRHRPPELGHHDPGFQAVQRCRHSADQPLGHQPQVHAQRLQDGLPRRR